MHSECSKASYYQPKNQHFFIINQKPKFCAIFFSKINPDALYPVMMWIQIHVFIKSVQYGAS